VNDFGLVDACEPDRSSTAAQREDPPRSWLIAGWIRIFVRFLSWSLIAN